MVRRHELTDAQWEKIAPLLPANGGPGGQWADHRMVINGILFRARTGVPWRDLPGRYGPWQTVYERHRRWSADGTWQKILHELQIEADATDPDGARPLPWQPPPGQRGDSPMFVPVLQGLRIRRRGPGRPRTRPDRLRGDKAYSSPDNHSYLRRRH